MKVHIIIDHPWRGSFNYAILSAYTEGLAGGGHSVDLLDLNQDEFNPVFSAPELALYGKGGSIDPKIGDYQQRLTSADYLVMIFPIWWYVMPACLKGWMDKVLLPGFAFSKGKNPQPLINHMKGALILTTSSVSSAIIQETYHGALDWVLCKGTLAFCGISPVTWHNFGETGIAPKAAHEDWLKFIRKLGSDL